MKRKAGMIVACVLVILGIVGAGIFLLTNKKESYRSIVVQELEGKTEVSRAGEELSAYQGMKLQRGDKVEVRKNSDLVLKLDQTKYVYAEESTCFRLKAIGKENSGKVKIVLEKGQTLVDIQEKLAEGESFEIETNNAVLSVRGTKFQVKVYTNETGEYVTEVAGYEGEVFLETSIGETTSVLPGKTVYVIGVNETTIVESEKNTEPEENLPLPTSTPVPTLSPTVTPTPEPTATPIPEPREELEVIEVYSDSGAFIEDAYVILEDANGNLYEAVLKKDSLGNQNYQATVLTGNYVIKVSAHGYFSVTKEAKVGAENDWKFTLSEKEMDLNYGELTGHSYRFIEAEAMTWNQAVQACYDLGGYPAVISSRIENDFLNKIMKKNGYVNAYFGYSDEAQEGTWVWLSGEASNYENWAKGEPNNSQNEDYAMFYYKFPNGEWNDGNFGYGTQNDTKVIICEWDSNDVMSIVMPTPTGIPTPIPTSTPTPIPTMAPYEGITEEGLRYTVQNGSVRVNGFEKESYKSVITELVIPGEIEGYPVEAIDNGAFGYCTVLERVELPAGIKIIGNEAFKHCYVLNDIILPESLIYLGKEAFWECHGLMEIVIPSGVTKIEGGVFSCCKSLVAVELPDGLTAIDRYAFGSCSSLEKIKLPAGLTEIEEKSFDKNMILIAEEGSYAATWAAANGYQVENR